jgi:PAS domain S-box-containing protein
MADDLDLRQSELTESEARYRNLFESVQDGVFETGSDGRFVRANQAVAEIFRVASTEDIIGRSAADFWVDPDERAVYLTELESRKSMGSYRIRSKRRDGTPIVVDVSAVRLEGPDGEFLGTEGIMRDVTESAEAADAMRRAADEWRTTFDSMSDLVSVHDGDYRIVKANAAMGDFFGMEPAELVGRSCHSLYHGSDSPCSSCPFPEMAGSLQTVSREIEEAHLGAPLLMTVSPIFDSDGRLEGCVHVARDVSERRKLEEQLRQSQKMEAIGRLAGGVAHDFNNMLSVIGGFTEEALAKIDPRDPAADDLREVRSAAERSANLTRQLLAFSRRQPIEPKVVDLNERLRSMEGMLRRLLGEDIRVELDLSQDLWPVRVDPSQMDQTVANLAANSRDAMPEGGTLRVESGNVTLGDLAVEGDGGVAVGDYVVLAVSDDGHGMDHETLRHVFEPFFTTKGEGRGTGLGLATVYGTVKQNGGSVDVDSAPGLGTTVRVYLPRYRGEGGVEHVPDSVRPDRAEKETVLLVEDERQVRRLVRIILGRLGYEVLEAEGPEEALALCAGHEGRIHLLLTDVVMPVMNGKELQERVSALLPGVKALFMSGYTADAIASRGVLHEGVEFLEKPFSPDQLGRKVREVLDRL